MMLDYDYEALREIGRIVAIARDEMAKAVTPGITTKELGFIDFSYAPPFASTWEAINVAANTAK